VDLHVPAGEVEGDVARVEVVVGEVLLDEVALVAEADDELLDAVGGVDLHDVPEDRLAPISTMGLGRTEVSSLSREPNPPAKITAFTGGSLALWANVSWIDGGRDWQALVGGGARRKTVCALGAQTGPRHQSQKCRLRQTY